jgi:hypothetical protein
MPITARTTLTDLIALVRRLVADTEAPTIFDDLDVQTALDNNRVDHIARRVEDSGLITTGARYAFTDYYTEIPNWEQDAYLQGHTYELITDSSSPIAVANADYLVGHWTLTAAYTPPIFITGKTFDLYAAAVELLEQLYAMSMGDFDFLSAGRTFKRSQTKEGIQTLIGIYRRRMKPTTIEMYRSDMNVMR